MQKPNDECVLGYAKLVQQFYFTYPILCSKIFFLFIFCDLSWSAIHAVMQKWSLSQYEIAKKGEKLAFLTVSRK